VGGSWNGDACRRHVPATAVVHQAGRRHSLAKRGLDTHTARVALCLDISFSMYWHYQNGRVCGRSLNGCSR
jgi:hypothetical protein